MRSVAVGLAALVFSAGAGLADPVEGIWKTHVDDGAYAHVKIAPCGDRLCGVFHKTFNSSGEYKSANLGKKFLRDMQPKGNGKYANGKIWEPSSDKTYKSKMQLNGNQLTVSGCVGPICKKYKWSRVK